MYQIFPLLKNQLFSFILFNNEKEEFQSEIQGDYWHLIQFISFILSGFIFIVRIPERFYPGSFDLFGQSHHTFHFTIFIMVYSQANAVFQDIRSGTSNLIEYIWIKDILNTIIVLIFQLVTVTLWYRISRPKIEQRYQIEIKRQF